MYCAANEQTFVFLQNVLAEVFELFPGKYIHIGGDEVSKDNWRKCPLCQARMKEAGLKNEEELQSYFIRRMEKYLTDHGRRLVGWSEIRQGGLASTAVMMDWIGGGKDSANEGHDVVMSPEGYCYLDHYQSLDYAAEPIAIGCYLPLWRAYAFEPVPEGLAPGAQAHILGVQGNMWTEYIASVRYLEYMTFPRLCALAEVAWSAKDRRDWDDFNRRLPIQELRLDCYGAEYRTEDAVKIGKWSSDQLHDCGHVLNWDVTPVVTRSANSSVILDDEHRPMMNKIVTEPGKCHVIFESVGGAGLTIDWVALLEDGREIARDTHTGFAGPDVRDLVARDPVYILSLTQTRIGVKYTVQAHVSFDGGNDSQGEIYFRAGMRPHSR